jgi:hypothetical protein
MATETCNSLSGCNLAYRVAAARTGLATPAMHPQVVSPLAVVEPFAVLRHPLGDNRLRPLEDTSCRNVKGVNLLIRQLRALAIGVNASLPEDLIRVGIADSGDKAMIHEDALFLSIVGIEYVV